MRLTETSGVWYIYVHVNSFRRDSFLLPNRCKKHLFTNGGTK
ncbi:hypothetical protein RR48_03087 [Papilio machaon]|uniref:Uncharacterized protein n=1 Tax=Papilio machaon TaxID=76193 RepID=A0A0N0PCI9_PAPMA|nr:hypothetical protein RR48_03087 [Papilio machaon]